ncbi:MAG: HEAT repeat domain-containing protein [Phycisphaerae bacterium]|nr:HEAT repeat domain-containing protein [Phycisphaerae bacterium]
MKSMTVAGFVIIWLGCSGFAVNPGDTPGGTEKRIQTLIRELDSAGWSRASEALVRIGGPAVDPLLDALNQNSHWISARASAPLSMIGSEKAVEGLLKALDNKALDNRIIRSILQSLGQVESERVVASLIRHLSHEDVWVRCAAVRSLGTLGGEKAEAALIDALQDRESYVVGSAIAELGQMKSASAPGPLVDCLEHGEGMTRIKVSRALVQIGETSVDAIVSNLRNDMDRDTCWHLVWALGQIKSDAASEPLVHALGSENWMVRNEAAVSLVRIHAHRSLDPLRRLLKSSHHESRTQAAWILKTLESGCSNLSAPSWGRENALADHATVSASEETTPVIVERTSYALCPHRFGSLPSVPSPYTADDGREIVVTSTQDSTYMLVPVTLENSDRKGRQRYVDADDFPTLAQTGYHSAAALERTGIITGRSTAEITELGRPGRLSTSGFLAADEDIMSVLKGDNRFARSLGLSHTQLARPLFHVLNLTDRNQAHANYLSYEGHRAEYPPCLYHGKTISVKVEYTRGGQESLFDDGLNGALAIRISRDLEPREKDYLDRKYSHLNPQQRDELVSKLSSLFIGEMVMYYVQWYGFYEGHTEWRADPIAIAFIFGMKDLEEIDSAFAGRLHHALTEHFTR